MIITLGYDKHRYMGKNNRRKIKHEQFKIDAPSPRASENPNAIYKETPLWSFRLCDFHHIKWGISNNSDAVPDILQLFRSLEGQNWGEILTSTSGRKNNTRNHPIPRSEIAKEAQIRASEQNLDEFDEFFSFVLTGKKRVWGILLGKVFHLVWYDPMHEIYPVRKTNT